MLAESPARISPGESVRIVPGAHDPFVLIGPGSDDFPDLFATSILSGFWGHADVYRRGDIDGATNGVWLRRSMAQGLQELTERLVSEYPGIHPVVFDGWRSVRAQKALWQQYRSGLEQQWSQEVRVYSDADVDVETAKYVSPPSIDSASPAMHSAGAMDVVLVHTLPETEEILRSNSFGGTAGRAGLSRRAINNSLARLRFLLTNSRQLYFGCPFDHGGDEASTRFYEQGDGMYRQDSWSNTARSNRAFLQEIFGDVFIGYEYEYWHFVSEASQAGAYALGRSAATHAGMFELTHKMFGADEAVGAIFADVLESEKGLSFASCLPSVERISPKFVPSLGSSIAK